MQSSDIDNCDVVYASWMREHACCAVLVRPDWHIFGTAADADAVRRLVAELGGRVAAGRESPTFIPDHASPAIQEETAQ